MQLILNYCPERLFPDNINEKKQTHNSKRMYNMDYFIRLTIIIFSIFLFSCQKNVNKNANTENIEVDIKQAHEKTLFTKYDYIKLETSDNCLLPSSINKIISHKDTIIIHSIENNNLSLFNGNGEFIKRFSIGNGPNEIIYPVDMTFDNTNNTIWILDSYRFMKEFSLDGIQKKEIRVEDPYMRIGKLNNTILLFDANLGKKNNYYFEFINDQNSTKYIKKKDNFKEIVYIPNSTFNIINDTTVYFYHQFEDIIYSWNLDAQTANPIYHFDFKNQNSIASIELKNALSSREYQKSYDNKEYIFGIKNLYSLNEYLFFTIETDKLYYCLYNNNNKKINICTDLIEGLPNPRNIIGFDGNNILYTLTAEELITYSKKNKISPKISVVMNDLKEDDNPIIFKCKFS